MRVAQHAVVVHDMDVPSPLTAGPGNRGLAKVSVAGADHIRDSSTTSMVDAVGSLQ